MVCGVKPQDVNRPRWLSVLPLLEVVPRERSSPYVRSIRKGALFRTCPIFWRKNLGYQLRDSFTVLSNLHYLLLYEGKLYFDSLDDRMKHHNRQATLILR